MKINCTFQKQGISESFSSLFSESTQVLTKIKKWFLHVFYFKRSLKVALQLWAGVAYIVLRNTLLNLENLLFLVMNEGNRC